MAETVPIFDFAAIIAALDRNTEAHERSGDRIENLAQEVHATNRRSVFQTAILMLQLVQTAVVIVLVVVVIAAVGSIRSQQKINANTFAAVVAATSPQAQARSAQVVATAIAQVEHCLNNHIDHDVKGVPLDPACPPQ